MIGDLLSTLANSNKLSIEQLQQAVQDGTVPSYIGIPMISQKVQQRQQAMSLLQGMQQQGQPPIGQQIMDQASQITHGGMPQQPPVAPPQQMPQQPPMAAPQQPQGIDAAPTNLPQQGYAPGGIVAFADGGNLPEDDPEYDPSKSDPAETGGMSNADRYLQASLNAPTRSGQYLQTMLSNDPGGDSEGTNDTDFDELDEGNNQSSSGMGIDTLGAPKATSLLGANHVYASKAIAAANKYGLPPALGLMILHNETGGMKDPANAVSKAGAIGPMQIMPATGRDLGIKDLHDVNQNIDGGMRYAAMLYHRYGGNPQLTLAAYNAGPGRVDQYLQSGQGLPQETNQYLSKAGMKKGGKVKKFSGADGKSKVDSGEDIPIEQTQIETAPLSDALTPSVSSLYNLVTDFGPLGSKLRAQAGVPTPTTLASPDPTLNMGDAGSIPQDQLQAWANAMNTSTAPAGTPPAGGAPNVTPPTLPQQPATPQSPIEQYLLKSLQENDPGGWTSWQKQNILSNQAELDQQKKLDPWLSLLSGSLGVMGGTSPFAAANIGKGAQEGIGTYAGLRKMEAAQDQGITSAIAMGARAQLYDQERKARIADMLQNQQIMNQFHQGQLGLGLQRIGVLGNRVAAAQQANQLKAEQLWQGASIGSNASNQLRKDLADAAGDPIKTQAAWSKYNILRNNYLSRISQGSGAGATNYPSYDSLMNPS